MWSAEAWLAAVAAADHSACGRSFRNVTGVQFVRLRWVSVAELPRGTTVPEQLGAQAPVCVGSHRSDSLNR